MLCRVIIAVVLLAGACSKTPSGGDDKARDAGPAAPIPVEVAVLATGPLENALRFSANLEAETQVQVLARAPGQVVKLKVEEGDQVKKNEVLLRLEDAEQRSALKRAETELDQGKRTFAKQEELLTHGVVSDDAREQAQFELRRLQIAFDDARRVLSYTVVRATVAGTVTVRQVKLGDYVNPNQHLFDVTDFESIVAKVFVPEKEVGTVKRGQVVRLFSPSSPRDSREAIVERVSPVVDPRSGTAKVTIKIPDTKDLQPGAFVSVELVTAENPNAVLLPRKALVYDDDEPFAFKLVGGDRVERVRVLPKLRGVDHVEASSGFAAGDKVVVAGQVGLRDKALVTAKVVKAPATASLQPPTPKPAKPTSTDP
jgi:membrane fusion protein (multidrug efflux system)